MNQTLHQHRTPDARPLAPAFTLVEILISILILALGVLGLGALFPVIIREQRLGTDAAAGVSASNSARAILTQSEWGAGLGAVGGSQHPILLTSGASAGTRFLWNGLRNPYKYSTTHAADLVQKGLGKGYREGNPNNFQYYGQGEWYTTVVDLATGALQLGYPNATNPTLLLTGNGNVYYGTTALCPGWVDVPIATRLYPAGSEPQFVWDVAFQRVSDFEHTHDPIDDAIRAAIFVRRLDPRLRAAGSTIREAIVGGSILPVGEDAATGNPTLDGTGQYSAIKTCEIEFFFSPSTPTMNHRDRLYQPQGWVYGQPANLARMWAQMKQPGQKLVDNLGNVYTVVGSGTESGVGTGEYLKIDPPVPESVTAERASPATSGEVANYLDLANPTSRPQAYGRRAIRQVAFTPQIPVSVTLVEVARGSGQ